MLLQSGATEAGFEHPCPHRDLDHVHLRLDHCDLHVRELVVTSMGGWPKGKPRGPRKQRVEILPHDPTAPFGPEAYERVHSDSLRAVEQTAPVTTPPSQPAPVLSDPPLTIRDQVLAGLCDPPKHYRKAIDYNLDPPEMPWQIVRCRECNDEMYTRNPQKRDVCEDCMWSLTQQLAEVDRARVIRNTDRLLNPFKSGNILYELGGSLPSVKK